MNHTALKDLAMTSELQLFLAVNLGGNLRTFQNNLKLISRLDEKKYYK